jgi:ATP-dependent Clp protease protease subunit
LRDIPTLTDLIYTLNHSEKAAADFDKVLETNAYFQREILVGDIDSELGVAINTLIRVYNQYDNENNIPVAQRKPIKIFIDSNGGELDATFTIIDSIKLSKTPVWTINIGCAYSGGFFIFINGHKRFAAPLSTFLYHEGSTANVGDAGKFNNFADFYKKQLELLKKITINCTNITEEMYKEHQKDDWWIDANEALELGICDEIVDKFI